MKTDAEAFAAYFEDWREGDPVPGGWYNTGGDGWCRFTHSRRTLIRCHSPHVIDIQALGYVLMVELAEKGHMQLFGPDKYGPLWAAYGDDEERAYPGPTPLCALVAAWKEVRDG